MTPINTAVIGYGLSAKIFHLPFILAQPDLFRLHSILQRKPTQSSSAPTDYPDVIHHTSPDTLLADPSLSLVVITSIPDSHFSLCKQALEAGKHVLVEKPFVPTSAEARTLAALAKQHGKVLSVYQNRRWDSDFLTLQQLVRDQVLGRIVDVETHFDRHRPQPPAPTAVNWKSDNQLGNGAIYDVGTHLLDQMITLFGLPDKVTAFIGNQRMYIESGTGEDAGGDSFTALLHYSQKGLTVTAKAGVVSCEPEQLRFWVRGEKGSFKKFNIDAQEDQLKAGKRPGQDADYGVEPETANGTLTRMNAGSAQPISSRVQPPSPPVTYVEFYRLLAAAIGGTVPAPVSAEEAGKVIRVIELAIESSKTGKTMNISPDNEGWP